MWNTNRSIRNLINMEIKKLKPYQFLISSMGEYLNIIKIATGDYGKDI